MEELERIIATHSLDASSEIYELLSASTIDVNKTYRQILNIIVRDILKE